MGFYFFPRGGSAHVARSLCRALRERDWMPTLFAGSFGSARRTVERTALLPRHSVCVARLHTSPCHVGGRCRVVIRCGADARFVRGQAERARPHLLRSRRPGVRSSGDRVDDVLGPVRGRVLGRHHRPRTRRRPPAPPDADAPGRQIALARRPDRGTPARHRTEDARACAAEQRHDRCTAVDSRVGRSDAQVGRRLGSRRGGLGPGQTVGAATVARQRVTRHGHRQWCRLGRLHSAHAQLGRTDRAVETLAGRRTSRMAPRTGPGLDRLQPRPTSRPSSIATAGPSRS